MGAFDNIMNKAQELNEQHGDKIEGVSDQALDRAGEAASSATGGKFDSQIEQVKRMADERIGTNDTEQQ